MEILKIISVVLLTLVVCVLIKQIRPELLPFVQIASVMLVAVTILDILKDLISNISEIISPSAIVEDEYIVLLVRVLGISVVVKFASDICRDNGNSILADNVELIGKIVIVVMCLPLVKIIAELAGGLLE